LKLLFDQNLSPKLVGLLSDIYPDSVHVQSIGLDRAPDDAVWNHARANTHIIVTKDADFHERTILSISPPKVAWVRRGNCSTKHIEQMLRQRHDEIQIFASDEDATVLILL